jgi:glycosyltransferase involved in cell wall biosynthesis
VNGSGGAARPPVLVDLQALQNPASASRGIGRYTTELALALEEVGRDLVAAYLINPDWPPRETTTFAATRPLVHSDRVGPDAGEVLHVTSPFEPCSLERIWPARLRSLRLLVTVHDFIPFVLPHEHLADPRVRQWYRTRLELVRRADRVLAASQATARDAVVLGIPEERVRVVGGSVSARFRPPSSPGEAFAALRQELEEIGPGYLLFAGNPGEPHKNLDGLLVAYAGLPDTLQARHQLVVAGGLRPDQRARLEDRVAELGIADRVRITGFVSEQVLVLLYQAATLFVFPSLYEGYGFPVAEAFGCGTPVLAGRTSSVVEIVEEPEALFDPYDPDSIRAVVERALTDHGFLAHLRRVESAQHTWRGNAERLAEVYDEVRRRPRLRRRRLRLGVFAPLPPGPAPFAASDHRLLATLLSLAEVDVFVGGEQREARVPAGVAAHTLRQFEAAERARGGYDAVIYCLGNSPWYAAQLAWLKHRPGIVLAHGVRLTDLYAWASTARPDLEPRSLPEVLRAMYGSRVPPSLGEDGSLDLEVCKPHGLLMAREAIAASTRFLVTSRYAAQLASLDAAPRQAGKIEALSAALPFAHEFVRVEPVDPVVATFALGGSPGGLETLVEAFAEIARSRPAARLLVVGESQSDSLGRHIGRAEELGLAERVVFAGEVSDDVYRSWVGATSVAVQLDDLWGGENPAVAGDCLAAGVPTIVAASGAAAELPDEAAVKVDPGVDAGSLAETISALLSDSGRRDALRRGALEYVGLHTYSSLAQEVCRVVEEDEAGRWAA